jgi:hypothetical protein
MASGKMPPRTHRPVSPRLRPISTVSDQVLRFHRDAWGTPNNVKALLTSKGPKENVFKHVTPEGSETFSFLTKEGDVLFMDGVGMGSSIGSTGHPIQHAVSCNDGKSSATPQTFFCFFFRGLLPSPAISTRLGGEK